MPRKKNNQHRLDNINDTIVILDKKKHVIEGKIQSLRDEAEELRSIIENEKKEQTVKRIAEALNKADLAISVDEFTQHLINLPAETLQEILRGDCVKQGQLPIPKGRGL